MTSFDLTQAEALTLLAKVNIAIEDFILGKRVTQYKIDSSDFSRLYTFESITLESLQAFKSDLLDYIKSLEPTVVPTFRTNACIPLVVRK
jgi:hypothetical protein